MQGNDKFHELLKACNIDELDCLRDGVVKSVHINKKNNLDTDSSFVMEVVFGLPNVISPSLEKEIRLALNNCFKSDTCEKVSLKIEYENPNIDDKMLEEYFNYILEVFCNDKPRFSMLRTFNHIYENNTVKFFTGDEQDKELVEGLLQDFDRVFKLYGLKVNLVVEISQFEVTTKTKSEEKIKIIDEEVLDKQRQYESFVRNKPEEPQKITKKPRMKSPLSGKVSPLSAIPATEVEVIEYSQKHNSCEFVVLAEITSCEIKQIVGKKDNKTYKIFQGVITDGSDSITVKTFISEGEKNLEWYKTNCVVGAMARIYGYASYDKFMRDVILNIKDMQIEGKHEKEDNVEACSLKRVELHAHSKMSVQDGLLEPSSYVKRAKAYGYDTLCITDHYNIQNYPDFYNECKKEGIKPILGVEGALVDEAKFKIALTDADIDLGNATYVVYDLETTGLSSNYDDIIEISACKVKHGMIDGEFSEFVKPNKVISDYITSLTSITNDDVKDAETIDKVLPRFIDFIGDSVLVAHNATFDNSHIYANLKKLGMYEHDFPTIDTLQFARVCYGDRLKRFDLGALCKFFDVELTQHHRAIYDALATANVFIKMLSDVLDKGIKNYNEINSLINVEEAYKLARPTHLSILSKNEVGKKNLYKIISDSHTTHFYREPRILKSYLQAHREGLLIGSGCINGDVFLTAYEKSYEELKDIMSFYDYIEIQPLSLYDVLFDYEHTDDTREITKSVIKTIVKAAHELGKIVVATGDCHHLDEEDKKYREIYIGAPQIGGGKHPLANKKDIPSFHFRSTEEMMSELSFLGDEVLDIVSTNTLKIGEMIEEYDLFPKELFAPKDDFLMDKGIPSVAEECKRMTFERAKEIYGQDLPKIIEDRLNKELDSIIGHSFGSIYYIAYMLVKYSKDAGYIVGSRGSVGSSLVANMMGITEVNSLAPHYYCKHCHFFAIKESDDEKKKYPMDENQMKFDKIFKETGTGYDLPDDVCPICGEKLEKSGVDIPFETFLGFDGTKTPDIDLNFSGDFQPSAHEFCRTVFGVDRAFRAGTIQTIAEKTAKGYVRGHFERKGIQARQSEIDRIGKIIEGVKRSTGQHPGGIVVLPKDIEYSDIVPIQYPADDVTASFRTTHYDYHKFENNLLKLDILGHDDPTMIKHLMDFVHKYPDEFPFSRIEDVPIADREILKLFNGLDSLGLDPSQTFEQSIGTTGIPEFGTGTAKNMLNEIRPTTIDDLLKISGLAHGTGVWQGNSRDFFLGTKKGFEKIPFKELIGCRDDIMVYLMQKNIPASDSFKIMESVRKGKGLKPEMEKEMREYNVPDWYIESCKLIEYMFPKAHATAYVIMALRIGWFKVYRPIYYYAGYFSRRADAYDVEAMASGFDAIKVKLIELKEKIDSKIATPKDEDVYNTLLLAIEMCARGYKFAQIDITRSEAVNFEIMDDKKTLLIPFSALDSLGESIAKSIVEAREQKMFTSKRDVLNRTKLNSTQFERLNLLGAFGDLPEDDQIGLF